jgi:hypothetical protein
MADQRQIPAVYERQSRKWTRPTARSLKAAAMNAAAHDLLLSLQATVRPSAAESWSDNIAKACGDFVAAFGRPAIRSATRLGLGPDDLRRFGDIWTWRGAFDRPRFDTRAMHPLQKRQRR